MPSIGSLDQRAKGAARRSLIFPRLGSAAVPPLRIRSALRETATRSGDRGDAGGAGLDLNDSVVVAIEKHSSREMRIRVEETIKTFVREIGETGQPRMLTLPLHPHLVGVPHRIGDASPSATAILRSSWLSGAWKFPTRRSDAGS